MDNMGRWLTGDAKQQFSEVLRQSETEPQEIYRRGELVAAVISADDWEAFRRFRESRQRRSLGDAADEIRELCARYDYELDTGDRQDRADWIEDAP
jgi:prevent-host-death family protein